MNGKDKILFDSNAIIYASQGLIDIEKLLTERASCYASMVTFIEVYSFNFTDPTEKRVIDRIIDEIEIIDLNRNIADLAIDYRKSKVKKIKLPDAVILATARSVNADLITNNLKDFENVDTSVNIINIENFKI